MLFIALACLSGRSRLLGQAPSPSPPQTSADFESYARKLRDASIHGMAPKTVIPTTAAFPAVSNRYPWKMGIVTTVFWIGKKGASTSNAWDPRWQKNYGGFDDPDPQKRSAFIPTAFVPKLNPFYIALPYNDVARGTVTKPEAKVVIPWFKEAFVEEGKSVCRDRWVAIRNAEGEVCYAQWSDCGPFHSDHWQYVFGNEKPKPNGNGGAGLNVSPAVRDYLGLKSTDVTDWKFVEFNAVPDGPWSLHGHNNDFLRPRGNPQERNKGTPPSGPIYDAPVPAKPVSGTVN
jgi:hypothetical protein